MSKTQNQLVLDHLIDHGFITPLVAFSYGITRLAARIKELKQQGVMINNTLHANDVGVRYSRYTLTHPGVERSIRSQGKNWKCQERAAA